MLELWFAVTSREVAQGVADESWWALVAVTPKGCGWSGVPSYQLAWYICEYIHVFTPVQIFFRYFAR